MTRLAGRARIELMLALAPVQAPAEPANAAAWADRIRMSPIAWVVAALLVLVAAYFLIRMLEWDAINKDTPNQEDPTLG